MANEVNITIRCNENTKIVFNLIAKNNPKLSKGELLEKMVELYQNNQKSDQDVLKDILRLNKLNHEYLALLVKSDRSIPTNVATMMKIINEEPMCDKYIKMKLQKEK